MKLRARISQCIPGSSLLEVVVASLIIATAVILFSGFVSQVVSHTTMIRRLQFLMQMKTVNNGYGVALGDTYPDKRLEIDYDRLRAVDGIAVRIKDTGFATPLVELYQLKNGVINGTIFAH